MKTRIRQSGIALGILLVLLCGQALADFTGYYAISPMNTGNWSLSNPMDISPRSGQSSVEIASDVTGDTQLTVTAQKAGTVTAQLLYQHRGASGYGYMINGTEYPVNSSSNQAVTFQVKAGDTFGFYIGSTAPQNAPSPQNPPGTLKISSFSPPSSSTCASGATAAPIISKVVPGGNDATVMFNYCQPAGQAVSYIVTAQPGGLTGAGSATPVIVSNLNSYTNYSFTVTATVGNNNYISAPQSAQTLCVITGTKPNGQNGCISAPPSPQAPTITGASLNGQNMQVNYSYSGPPQTLLFQAQATSTSTGKVYNSAQRTTGPLIINGLTPGHIYTVMVVASNTAGMGTASAPLKVGLAQLTIDSVVPGNQSAKITFGTSNGSDSGANISLTATPVGGGQAITAANISNPYILQGLNNGTSYTVTLMGINRYGSNSSLPSTVFTPGTVPGAPLNLQVLRGDGQATVTFQPPASNGGSAITKYSVVMEPGNIVVPVLESPAVVQGLSNGQQYAISVVATNAWGNGPTANFGNYMPGTLPASPTLQQIMIGDGLAQVFFNPLSNHNDLPITGYTVVATPPYGTPGGVVTASGKASPVLLTNLINGASYQLMLSATNILGQGPTTGGGVVVTTAQPNRPVIQSVAISGNNVAVSFYQGQPGHDPAKNYLVEAFEVTSTSALAGTGISFSGATSPLALPPLPWGKTYQFTVTAFNPTGPNVSAPSISYGMQRNRWMTGMPDNIPLGLLMVPGTHDSGSYDMATDLGETQDWDIATQLDNGIRFLDVRVANANAGNCSIKFQSYPFEVRHGFLCLGNFQTMVMEPVNNFLKNNPKETVMMSIRAEDTLNNSLFMKTVINQPANGFLTQVDSNTSLGSVRGKVVLFDRFGGGVGVPWAKPQMQDQDDYDLDNNCYFILAGGFFPWFDCSIDYPSKAQKVIEFLNLASQQQKTQGAASFWINFASAQWKGLYIGNNAEVANAGVTEYFRQLNQGEGGLPPARFGSTILMDYPDRQGDKVINSLLNFNRVAH